MNYALDALWWQLTDPHVRALASIVSAPSLWHNQHNIHIRELLGEHGFRYLLNLNENPQILHQYLQAHQPFAHRLGFYAEHLTAFWLTHAPHCQLLAHNLAISDGIRTLGALDFIAQIGQQIYHLELTCKYYGTSTHALEDFIGLNTQDKLSNKIKKLNEQITLLHHPATQQTLHQLSLHPQQIQSATIIRGTLFAHEIHSWQAPLNPHAWHGGYFNIMPSENPFGEHQRFAIIPRMELLAPLRIQDEYTLNYHQLIETIQQAEIIAILEYRPDKHWHETARIMIRQ